MISMHPVKTSKPKWILAWSTQFLSHFTNCRVNWNCVARSKI